MKNLLAIYTLCVVILFLKMLAISCYQGFHRIGKKAFKNAEDAQFVGATPHSDEVPQVLRAAQAWMNDLENIPVFFVLGALCVVLNTDAAWTMSLFIIFTVARITHTVTYLNSMQPWRSISYAVAILCLLVMAGMLAIKAMNCL
ncbi:glutathione S-transferase [Acinetobacter calcoaceticus]|uniref:Microsomal glutathione S-transferase 1 n=1 Tax=Acinetobacter calcoaceticus TaxID=471 RepID=A0A4R1XZE2_ACICA|nr:glutathione S-transferase [Acinetobacter calcoaceticus]